MIDPIQPTAPELTGRAVASQRWSKLAFLHWRVPASALVDLMPVGVRPDEHDGSSWVGLIYFYLDRATLSGSPPIPYLGSFTEVNVRLYGVDEQGRRGVVFCSLEASRLAAVLAARAAFSIPYFWARTSLTERDGSIHYHSRRHLGRDESRLSITPGSTPITDDPTAQFLTARWGLFTRRFGRTILLPNHHAPWNLVDATVISLQDTLLERAGIPGLADTPPDSVLYSEGVTTWFGKALR
ncbi:DUF2071 domain-containing protein [Salinibacterium sp.]|uniref:YqjF family protein n=1 Tax=Salinibacterium sp. TaxID=1915057 RepID=UPI00286B9D61|nr:DUF2071 domain-containing protein [Salinibacterium sp.]